MDYAVWPRTFGFFLVPKFAKLAFTSAVEPLRAANLLSGQELYRWRAISRDGRPVAMACGFVSPSHFAKCYREHYKQIPKNTRQSGAWQPRRGYASVPEPARY